MASFFSLSQSHVSSTSETALLEEIRAHTGCEEQASSILRGIERLAGDASIRQYDMTPTTNRRAYRGAPPVSWSVRAVRP
ncbi:MAG: hypothetical protein AB1941_02055 [Gemmatimonadota bacterium]